MGLAASATKSNLTHSSTGHCWDWLKQKMPFGVKTSSAGLLFCVQFVEGFNHVWLNSWTPAREMLRCFDVWQFLMEL